MPLYGRDHWRSWRRIREVILRILVLVLSFGISMFSYSGVKDTNVLTFNINSEKVVGLIGLRCLFYVVILCFLKNDKKVLDNLSLAWGAGFRSWGSNQCPLHCQADS